MQTPKLQCLLVLVSAIVLNTEIEAQNVGINATGAAPNASAMLDIVSTTRGLLVPRMTTVQRTAIATPAQGLYVYDLTTNSFWFYNGTVWVELSENNGWKLIGNNLTGTEFIGSINNQPFMINTNNTERMRVFGNGQIGVNTAAPAAANLFSVTATATERVAIAGFSSSTTTGNSAVYGEINSSASSRSYGVYGVFNGVNTGVISASGVCGITNNTTQGANYTTSLNRGVWGTLGNNVQYSFGVFGNVGTNLSTRTGGVLGQNSNGTATWTSIAYFSAASTSYGVYSSNATNGSGAGRLANPTASLFTYPQEPNFGIGAGLSGGVMGAWIHGQVYGTVLSGNRFGVYVDGLTITNNAIVQLVPVAGNTQKRIATYASTGITQDVYAKGKAELTDGVAVVYFDSSFAALTGSGDNVVVTVTPLGQSAGIYISEIRADGFVVRENNGGASSINFTWIAVCSNPSTPVADVSPEIRDVSFDQYIRMVMLDDSFGTQAGSVWWDGTSVRFDIPPRLLSLPAQAQQ